ncbi:DUF624 domain-containing protein [Clostridium gasigenes]|uniref:DUF624 domain-containing protein n=1 Tax=Clostridium gasigenes TaxID=94869 RepID=UPI001C0D8974|nr:DUF624 domain-containing protein [Clostridium gasigenes]MBU3136899.1 DUF624 domain-containing protein [Clostridium gasigenes]
MGDFFNLDRIFDIFNYIFWFFLLNLFFMIFNIPIILFFVLVGISNIFLYLPLFLICLIPIGPSLTALLYCTGKLIRNRDLNIINDFIKGLKLNFKQSTLLWCFELIVMFILYSNIKFFSTSKYSLVLTCLFASLTILVLLTTPYIYILISRFSMNNMNIIKASLILVFTRPMITISNIVILIFSLILFEMTPGTTILFISSIFAFLLSFTNKALLLELETTKTS